MKTRRPLGTRQREAITAAREERATIGHGEAEQAYVYQGALLPEYVPRAFVESSFREEAERDISSVVRAEVSERSGGRCEVGGPDCWGAAVQKHHRKLRRFGDHRAVNLLDVCIPCHAYVHTLGREAYLRGWLVNSNLDPAKILW